MKDREGFLLKLCIALCVVGYVVIVLLSNVSCSSSSKVVISKEVVDAA